MPADATRLRCKFCTYTLDGFVPGLAHQTAMSAMVEHVRDTHSEQLSTARSKGAGGSDPLLLPGPLPPRVIATSDGLNKSGLPIPLDKIFA